MKEDSLADAKIGSCASAFGNQASSIANKPQSAIRNPQLKLRILILTLSFGSGHLRAARVVADEIKRREPTADVRVVDALGSARVLFRAFYELPYWLMIRHAPRAWEWFFTHRKESKAEGTAPQWAWRWGCKRTFDEIKSFQPRVVLACEVAACEIAAMAKREGLTEARLVNVITDYEAEPIWVKSEVDLYAVPDERVREELIEWGAAKEKILTCGIPIDAKFETEMSAGETQKLRAKMSIGTGAPIVLLMGGGMGPTRMDRVAAELCNQNEMALNIIAVAGHDKRAQRRLEDLRARLAIKRTRHSLQVFGWTNDVAALMKTASVLVTKPGGLSTSEAAACRLPCVLFDAIPGPEERNAARLVKAGAGVSTRGSIETAAAVLNLLRDEAARERMALNLASLARPRAAQAIARTALGENLEETDQETTIQMRTAQEVLSRMATI